MSNRGDRLKRRIDSEVVAPTSLGEALQVLRHNTTMDVWAGGTWWMSGAQPRAEEDRSILSLHEVRELRRVVRSVNQVEIGSAVPIARLQSVGVRFLPAPVVDAISQIGPPPIRNLATLGGAVSIPGTLLPVTSTLQLLDTRVELRRQGNSRWIPLAQLRDASGLPRFEQGEIIARLRIPAHHWTHWMIHTWGNPFPAERGSLTMVAAATLEKTGISEFRFALLVDSRVQIRLRDAETDLVGRSVPLTERDRRAIISALEHNPLFGSELDDLGRWRAANGLRLFLHRFD